MRAADLVGLWAFAGTAVSAARSGDSRDDDLEGTQVLDEDQAARTGKGLIRWSEVAVSDAERRAAVRRRLDCGALHTATDFWRAAFVFQHGDKPGDGLLAHTRSVVAPTKGRKDAAWIASASLDRYLQSMGKDQISGTPYRFSEGA